MSLLIVKPIRLCDASCHPIRARICHWGSFVKEATAYSSLNLSDCLVKLYLHCLMMPCFSVLFFCLFCFFLSVDCLLRRVLVDPQLSNLNDSSWRKSFLNSQQSLGYARPRSSDLHFAPDLLLSVDSSGTKVFAFVQMLCLGSIVGAIRLFWFAHLSDDHIVSFILSSILTWLMLFLLLNPSYLDLLADLTLASYYLAALCSFYWRILKVRAGKIAV